MVGGYSGEVGEYWLYMLWSGLRRVVTDLMVVLKDDVVMSAMVNL